MAAPRGPDGAWALPDPWPPWLDGGEEDGGEEEEAGGEGRDGGEQGGGAAGDGEDCDAVREVGRGAEGFGAGGG